MAVYYDSCRKGWYIRVKVGEKYFSCYHVPNGKGFFPKKADAKEYEPTFVASLLGENTKEQVVVDDHYIGAFKRFLKTKLKPSTYYGYINTFEKYWQRRVIGIDVKSFNNVGLEAIVDKVFAGKSNWNGKAAVGKWFVKFMRKVNPNLDPLIVVAPKTFTPKTHEYNVYSEEEFKKFMSVIDDDKWRFLFLLLFNYGLRISECLGLRWTDFKGDGLHIERCACVKNDSHKVIFTSPKTSNSYRVYPIVDAIRPYIAKLKPAYLKENHQVFEADKKGAVVLGQTSVRRHCEQFSKQAGLSPSGSMSSATPACRTC